jgi:hypothetical protein
LIAARASRVGPTLLAAIGFLALAAAFLARSLSPDGLLSPPSQLGGRLLWPDPLGAPPRLSGASFETADHVALFAPYAAFIQRELAAGRLPLWNPLIGLGTPVVESMQPTLLHPFTLLLYALPSDDALTLLVVLRLALAGLGGFTLARTLGLGRLAATLCGLLFMLSPFHLRFRLHTLPNVSALLPFLLACSELQLRGGSSRRCGAAWSLLGALAFLGGHPETSVHTIAAAWTYHLLRAAGSGTAPPLAPRLGAALLFLSVCTALAMLAATAVLWAHLEALLESFVLRFRLMVGGTPPAADAFAPLVPGSQGYAGILALLLAARGLPVRGPFPAWPWLGLGAAALLAALRPGPLAAIVDALPIVRTGIHDRAIFVAHLAIAVLAARGLAAPTCRRTRWAVRVTAALIASSLAVSWAPVGAEWTAVPRALALPLVFLCIGATALELIDRTRWRGGGAVALIVAVFAELYATRAPAPQDLPARLPPMPPLLRLVDTSGRAYISHELLVANMNMVYGVPGLGAYDAMLDNRMTRLLLAAGLQGSIGLGVHSPGEPARASRRLLDLLNVRTIVTSRPIEDPELAATLEPLASSPASVYRNPHALPRAFVVEKTRSARDPNQALRLVLDPRIDLAQVVVLEPAPRAEAARPLRPGRARPGAEVLDHRPGDVRIAVSAPRGGYLVFSETYLPGWTAELDGAPAPVLRGDYALISVPLRVGSREVALRYRPAWLTVGGPISLVAVAALAAAALLPRRRAASDDGTRSGPGSVAPSRTAASSTTSAPRASPLRSS